MYIYKNLGGISNLLKKMWDMSADKTPANSELYSTAFTEHATSDSVSSILKILQWQSVLELVYWCVCQCVWVSAPVTAVSWVPTTAVVFALVATLPLSVPVIGPRSLPLPPLSSMTTSSLVFVFLWGEVIGATVSVSFPVPLSVPVSVYFDRSTGPWPRTWALPLVTRSPAVAVASTGLWVAVAMMAGLGLEVGEEGWGRMPARRWTATVRARSWARTIRPWATMSAVVTVETKREEEDELHTSTC